MQLQHAGEYSVAATQPELRLTVTPPPAKLSGPIVIKQQPQPRTIPRGSNATFQVAAEGLAPLSYQWFFNEAAVSAATNASLVVTNAQLAQQGTYSVVVSNSYGAMSSTPAALEVLVRPAIMLHPVSQSVVAGGSVTLSASVEGSPLPLVFRWRRNGSFITNLAVYSTNGFLTLTNLQATPTTNQFTFAVAVTNAAGSSSLSSNAVITVLADTDGDGMPDEWELAHNFDPQDPTDATRDPDLDGFSNLDEYSAGTDPLDRETLPEIYLLAVTGSPQTASLLFVAYAGKTYSVLRRDSAGGGAWIPVADVPATSTNGVVEVRDAAPPTPGHTQRFYRLVTPRLPP
jgi:hypothetical protein